MSEVKCKFDKARKRSGEVVPFDKEKITYAIFRAAQSVGGKNLELSRKITDDVIKMLNGYPSDTIPSVEEIQDAVEKTLIENGHALTGKAFILYRNEHSRKRAENMQIHHTADNIPYKKLYNILRWYVDHDLETVDKLNNHITNGRFADVIKDGTDFYMEQIKTAASLILDRKDEVRVVIVAGPSSSGKTTTTIKMEDQLKKHGFSLVAMNLDNYFLDLDVQPKDEYGDYDFEQPEALDLDLINEHLRGLLAGEEIQMPIYNFKTGKREEKRVPLKINKNEIVLIDTLHGLFPQMTAGIPESAKFKLYIETLMQMKNKNDEFIRWTDLRLLRRMIRDSHQRSYDPRRTLEHWHYVRRSELKHIIPYIDTVHYIVNSALPFELPFMKKYLFHYFQDFIKDYKDREDRQDCYVRAKRVYEMLDSINVWDDDSIVPQDSLLREFIGGSIYTY